jgi:hypothetical protein
MHKYFLLLLSLCPFIAFSQGEFAPEGAEWTYDYSTPDTILGKPIYMTAQGTTTINGQVCRELRVVEIDFTYNLNVFSRNDSVFIYDEWNSGAWRLLYDYSAGPGDTWEIPYVGSDFGDFEAETMTVTVDSIGTVNFCNQPLRAWYISFDTTRFRWGRRIVEWAGNVESFMPYKRPLRQVILSPLRCYRDDIRTCKAVPYRCDTLWASASEPMPEWSVYPNPVEDILEVSIRDNAPRDFTLVLYELTTGHPEALFHLPESGRQSLDVKEMPPGVYVLAVWRNGAVVDRQKIIIQR